MRLTLKLKTLYDSHSWKPRVYLYCLSVKKDFLWIDDSCLQGHSMRYGMLFQILALLKCSRIWQYLLLSREHLLSHQARCLFCYERQISLSHCQKSQVSCSFDSDSNLSAVRWAECTSLWELTQDVPVMIPASKLFIRH